MSSVTINNGRVPVPYVVVINDDNLGLKRVDLPRRVILAVPTNIPPVQQLDTDSLDVEADVVSGDSMRNLLVVHLYGLAVCADVDWCEIQTHVWHQHSCFYSSHWHCPYSTDFVHILKWNS